MKKIFIVVLLIIACLGVWIYFAGRVAEPSVALRTAFGRPANNQIVMETVITVPMSNVDPPTGDTRYNSAWQRWVDDHFDIVDASGKKVPVTYRNAAKLPWRQITSDHGFMAATLTPGAEYHLSYRPRSSEKQPYKTKLIAPDSAQEVQVLNLYQAE